MSLDNLEYISVENQVTDFPQHFHETFCISLIHSGIEVINVNGQQFFSEKCCITITNPFEVHSNPILDKNVQLAFDTIYVSQDVMKYMCNGQHIIFQNRKIIDQYANQLFLQVIQVMDANDQALIELHLGKFIQHIQHFGIIRDNAIFDSDNSEMNLIKTYIDQNISEKMSLDDLAKIANINKFGFAKKFKLATGMSPANYILMKKIFKSKQLIEKETELTQIAFDFDFSDLAHFSKTFKRFVGIAPRNYQNSLKFGSK